MKKKKFTASQQAKRLARRRVGAPPVEKIYQDRRFRPPKHKKKLAEEQLD
jgi:hypothetical protein